MFGSKCGMIDHTLEHLSVLCRCDEHVHFLLDSLQIFIALHFRSDLGWFEQALVDRFTVQVPGEVRHRQSESGDASRLQRLVRPDTTVDEGRVLGELQLCWARWQLLPHFDRCLMLFVTDHEYADKLAEPFGSNRGQSYAAFTAGTVSDASDATGQTADVERLRGWTGKPNPTLVDGFIRSAQ